VVLPFAMAAAAIAALENRRARRRGCHIDASMYELCVQQMRDAFAPGASATRPGNSDPRMFHQGVYAAQGDDRWVAVSFETPAQWQAFARAAGVDAADVAARDAALARWCASRTDQAAAASLQELGIAAAAAQDMSDLFDDAQLQARRPLVPMRHPLLGEFGHMGTPIAFSRSTATPYRAPGMGEHNRRIATEICGLSPSKFEELDRQGVFR
jgi:crotonobetainyl-CoA:carnitine CoA-transferase CaiB-like acyl-CoA transferase